MLPREAAHKVLEQSNDPAHGAMNKRHTWCTILPQTRDNGDVKTGRSYGAWQALSSERIEMPCKFPHEKMEQIQIFPRQTTSFRRGIPAHVLL